MWPEPLSELECRARLRTLPHPHYVYMLHRPDGTPFYVGKGVSERAIHHVREARNHPLRLTHKLNTIRAIMRRGGEIGYSVAGYFIEEEEAHALEVHLIRRYGRYDLGLGTLTNQTDGGEGGSNPSAESRLRKLATLAGEDADSEERRAANRFFKRLLDVDSVPIKQVGSLGFELLTPHSSPRRPRPRQAAALAASAIANRVLLQKEAVVPRRMYIDGHVYLIENGCGRDILKSGLAELIVAARPEAEAFRITEVGVKIIEAAVDRRLLLSSGVLAE